MTPANHPDRPLAGIVIMVAAMLLLPVLDLCAKILSQLDYHVLQVSWLRFTAHLLWMLPILMLVRQDWTTPPARLGLQLARGACLLLATIFFFVAISHNTIPNSLALLFVSPLIVTLLSPALLGESVGIRRLLATATGFVGVLVVLQPQAADFQPSILFALLAGVCYSFYIILTRKLTAASSPVVMLFYTALVGCIALLPAMPAVWSTPDRFGWMLIAVMGGTAAIGHFLVIIACRMAPASLLAPFNYTEIIGATALSYVFFSYLPEAHVWLGVGIIALSGLYTSYRETRANKPLTFPLDSR